MNEEAPFYNNLSRYQCDLCDLVRGNIVTRKYYRNSEVTIVDCLSCHVPMLVFNHCGEASVQERRRAQTVVDYLFTYSSIRRTGKKNLKHEHWHIYGKLKSESA